MKKVRFTLSVLFLLCISISAIAQNKITLRGTVVDNTNQTVIGASVIEKGTTNGTVTDVNGKFVLNVSSSNAIIQISYIGFDKMEISAASFAGGVRKIQLKESSVSLGEVVAIGYATVKKNDATGSVIAIKPDKLNKGLTTNAQDMIVGKIAGVNVSTKGGAPGEGATIRIRGGSSLNASNDPLIVIDGLAMDNEGIKGVANFLSTINPNDIESFTVLKDASATAIYGSRASNGVIIITTKKGEKGSKPRVSYDGNMSISAVGKTIDVLTGDEFRDYVKKLYAGQQSIIDELGTENTDWQKEIYQTAISHDHNINIMGGLKNMPYRASVGYTNQEGVLKTSSFERYTGAISLNPSFFQDHLKVNLNAKGMLVKTRYADTGAIGAALAMDPTKPVMSADADYQTFDGYWQWTQPLGDGLTANTQATKNPVATLMQKNERANSRDFIGNAEFDYKFHFLPELRAHLNLAMEEAYGKQKLDISKAASSNHPHGRTGWEDQNKSNKSLSYYMQYGKEIGKINFDVMGGYEWQHFYRDSKNQYVGLDGYNPIYTDDTRFATESYLVSYFGRLNFSWDKKYLLTATVRDDASSRFSKENRWGLFPAMAFAWKINEEGFLKDIQDVSDMKLRLGYGVTGQQNISQGDYPYIPVYTYNQDGAYYPFGDTYYSTSRPDAYNPDLKWEETTTWNAGLDFGFFNSRLNGAIDFYYRKTNDLINVVSVPAGTNFRNKVISNVGSLENKGVEFSINAKPITKKDLTWEVGYNITFNNNKITKLTKGDVEGYYVATGGLFQGSAQAHAVGYPANSFYVYEQVYDNSGKPIEGLYVDRNGDGIVNEKDKYFFHNPNPDVMMGLTSKVIYKNFDLGISLRASIGNYVYNAVQAERLNVGPNGVWSSLGFFSNKPTSSFENNFSGKTLTYLSDYYVQNASFVRCDNITLGYTFKNLFKAISSGRVYATVQNPFVITKYKGLDPEVTGNPTSLGIDNNIYPRPIITVVGLSLNF